MKILFASKNKNKFKEIKEIFKDSKFEIIFDDDLEDVVEDKDTILGNAQKKSEEIFLKHNIPVLSDDSGLFVEALGNLPGVSTARSAGENASDQENIEKMLKNLSNEERISISGDISIMLKNSNEFEHLLPNPNLWQRF